MNQFTQVLTPLTMLLSLSTACGVLLHDTNIDKAVLSAVDSRSITTDGDAGQTKPGSTPHTHSEGPSLSKVVKEGRTHPRSTPRAQDRKHTSQKRMLSGDTDIDGHRLIVHPAELGANQG